MKEQKICCLCKQKKEKLKQVGENYYICVDCTKILKND